MTVRVTETRYGFMQIVVLVELNTAILLSVLSLVAVGSGYYVAPLAAMSMAILSIVSGLSSLERGYSYRLMDRMGIANEWTLDDVEHDTLRKNGAVELNINE